MVKLGKSDKVQLLVELSSGNKKLKFFVTRGRTYRADLTIRPEGAYYKILGTETSPGRKSTINETIEYDDVVAWLDEFCNDTTAIVHYTILNKNIRRHGRQEQSSKSS